MQGLPAILWATATDCSLPSFSIRVWKQLNGALAASQAVYDGGREGGREGEREGGREEKGSGEDRKEKVRGRGRVEMRGKICT